jgi:hypothetical protein
MKPRTLLVSVFGGSGYVLSFYTKAEDEKTQAKNAAPITLFHSFVWIFYYAVRNRISLFSRSTVSDAVEKLTSRFDLLRFTP